MVNLLMESKRIMLQTKENATTIFDEMAPYTEAADQWQFWIMVSMGFQRKIKTSINVFYLKMK